MQHETEIARRGRDQRHRLQAPRAGVEFDVELEGRRGRADRPRSDDREDRGEGQERVRATPPAHGFGGNLTTSSSVSSPRFTRNGNQVPAGCSRIAAITRSVLLHRQAGDLDDLVARLQPGPFRQAAGRDVDDAHGARGLFQPHAQTRRLGLCLGRFRQREDRVGQAGPKLLAVEAGGQRAAGSRRSSRPGRATGAARRSRSGCGRCP